MIIDLQRFIAAERPFWSELEKMLDHLEAEPNVRLSLEKLQRFHHLYERAAADLGRLTTFSAEPETRRYLESLISRAYGEIHETREKQRRIFPLKWFFQTLPQTFAILWTLQRACEIQLATFSMGRAIPVGDDIASRCTRDALQFNPDHGAGQDMFDALTRQVAKLDASYLD